MSSEEKSKTEEKKKSDKEKAKAKAKAKDEAKNKSKTSSGGGNKKATTVAEIKAEEYSTFIKSSVVSHAGWLSTPLQNISPSLSLSIPQFSLILLSLFTLLLLLSPSGWIPHISSPIVLLIPLQNTLLAITHEKRNPKHTARTKGSGDECIQWIVFWVGWIMLGWVGESIRVFKPGWRGIWEIGKVGAGIVLAGPWFSRDALVPGKPSPKLIEAEKREAAEEAKGKKEVEKKRAAGDDEEKVKARAKAKQKQKEKEQRKEKSKKEKQE